MKAALIIVLLSSPLIVHGYPYLWTTQTLPDEVLKGAPLTPENCIRHPTTKEGSHGAPSVDRMITMTAGEPRSTALAAVKELCPGVEYEVTVRYPDRRRTLLTTTVGKWAKASAVCPGRVYTGRVERAADIYKANMAVPCNTTAESTTLQVTSAAGSSAAYKTATLTLPIAPLDKCPQSTCPTVTPAKATAANRTATNTTTAANATLPALAGNKTLAGAAANKTIARGAAANKTAAANATLPADILPADALNTTEPAANTTAETESEPTAAGPGAASPSPSPAAASPARAAADAPKPKSAAALSGPASLLAAAGCVVVAAAILL